MTSSINNQNDLIRNVLFETYPDELLIMGPALVNDLISGYQDFKDPQKASNLDQSVIVSLITSSVSVIVALIELYAALAKKEDKKTSDINFKIEAKNKINNLSITNLTDEQINLILESFIKQAHKK